MSDDASMEDLEYLNTLPTIISHQFCRVHLPSKFTNKLKPIHFDIITKVCFVPKADIQNSGLMMTLY